MLCDCLKASMVTTFLQGDGEYQETTRECVTSPARAATFRNVRPGTVTGGMVLVGAEQAVPADGDAGSSSDAESIPRTCLVLNSDRVVVAAGVCGGVRISIPTGAQLGTPCEENADVCGDGLDNDGDGRTDCDNPKCQQACGRSEGDKNAGGAAGTAWPGGAPS